MREYGKKAIFIDPQCLSAHLGLADYWLDRNEEGKAFKAFMQAAKQRPDMLSVIYPRLQPCALSLQKLGELERLLRSLSREANYSRLMTEMNLFLCQEAIEGLT